MFDGDTDGILLILQNKLGKLISARQDFGAWRRFVASLLLRRNKLEKISNDYLERAETRRNFAVENKFDSE